MTELTLQAFWIAIVEHHLFTGHLQALFGAGGGKLLGGGRKLLLRHNIVI